MKIVELDVAAFERGLLEGIEFVKAEARERMTETAERVAARARVLAPKSTDPQVESEEMRRGDGHIRDSISVRRKSKNVWLVEVHAFHAPFVEFGTSRMPPRPFLRSAAEEERG